MSGVAGRALVLVGFMGSGKSSSARSISPGALDSDALIEAELGASVGTIFERDGEAAFRAAEERVVLEALNRVGAGAGGGVISLGGGALGSAAVREALTHHTVVLLDSDVETAWRRVRRSKRPLVSDRESFDALHSAREATYLASADAIVPAERRESLGDALPSIKALAGLPAGTRLLWAESDSGSYPVWVGENIAGRVAFDSAKRWAIVSDTNVAGLYGAAFPDAAQRLVMEPGEEHKTLVTCERLWTELAAAGISREDGLIALGGGVVGDVTGFVAASYQRGIPVVQVPTTLVSQVDSAYGGKTGVDLPSAKNYVGAYHQPSAVVADTSLLASLPSGEVAAGMAEVIKTALISGGPLWDSVKGGVKVDSDMVLACARTKLRVVSEDERDGGRRQVLNLGHTVGHAIETATGYRMFRHGEAVGIGLLAALRLSGHGALRTEVAELLGNTGLPLSAPNVDPDAVFDALQSDKKRHSDGTIPFVMCEAPGQVSHGHVIPLPAVMDAIKEVCQ